MAAQGAQSRALVNLLKTGDYSDLTITCGKDQYRVHKAIICPRSRFFKAACDGKFKEAQTSTINLPDDDPIAVRMMIEYLYHDTYTPNNRDSNVDAHLSDTEYNDEKEKRKMELYGATFVGNKRIKMLTAPPEAAVAPVSQPEPPAFVQAAAPPPPPPVTSQGAARGSGRSRRGRGSFGGVNSPSGQTFAQASPNQSSPTTPSFMFGSPAPAPNPPAPPQPSAPPGPILDSKLHLHTKVYALGEKYGIRPLKALALREFICEAQFHLHSNDFLQAIREAYTSTIETDRPLRDAVVTILRTNKHLLKKDSMKEVLKDTGLGLGFDLLMAMATE